LPDKAPVFISYAREDSTFVKRLISDLKAAGANVWLDQIDIRPGSRWDREVEKALTNCSELIVVVTSASIKSDQVMDEISYALDERKTIIPIINGECSMPFRLRRLQYVDFRSDYPSSLGLLLKSLSLNQQVELVADVPKPAVVNTSDRIVLAANLSGSDAPGQDRDSLSFLNQLTTDKGSPFLARPFLLPGNFVCASNGHALFAVRLRTTCPIPADPVPEKLSQMIQGWLRTDPSGAIAVVYTDLINFAAAVEQGEGQDPVQVAGVFVDLRMLRPYIEHLNAEIVRVWAKVTTQFADVPTMLTIEAGDRIVVAMGLKPDTVTKYRVFTPRGVATAN
jgi:TIR domain